LGGSGHLNGDVKVARLTVEDGATLNGNVTMQAEKA
jgi:cytoskeletal protein CcmA (bactofilin family)